MPFQITEKGDLIADEKGSSGNFVLRSEEVSEIISSKPSFLIRWGITIFFLILLCIVAACWFIQFPDIVPAKAKLTSINAPKEVKTRSEGKLISLFAKEDQQVKQNDILGYIESRANHNEVLRLSSLIDRLQVQINQNQTQVIKDFHINYYLNLGEVQQHYQTFIHSMNVFKQYLASGYFAKKRSMLRQDFRYLDRQNKNLAIQQVMQEENLALQKESFKAREYLHSEKVISADEFRDERSKLIGKELSIPQLTSSIILNESNKHEKQKQIMELENDIAQQKNIFVQALNTFKAELDGWKSKYLLIAPVTGKVAFATFVQENQQLQNNQTICFINPSNSEYYAEVFIPQANFGKLKKEQKVLLEFPSYPHQEYGKLEGRLNFISNIPTDSGYLAKVNLTNGLKTNYNRDIQHRDGLTAQAQIVTKDMRLFERFFYNLKKVKNE
jgi:HlyD family secretion protein